MRNAAWDVWELSAVDWMFLRDARRRALEDSPQAFLSHPQQEASWDEREWRRTIVAANWLVAHSEEIIGILRAVRDPIRPRSRDVQSIWVAPTHRKRGVFRAMLYELAERERKAGASDLMLWVLEDNHDAQQVYERLGFQSTGERQRLPDETGRYELRLGLAITGLLTV